MIVSIHYYFRWLAFKFIVELTSTSTISKIWRDYVIFKLPKLIVFCLRDYFRKRRQSCNWHKSFKKIHINQRDLKNFFVFKSIYEIIFQVGYFLNNTLLLFIWSTKLYCRWHLKKNADDVFNYDSDEILLHIFSCDLKYLFLYPSIQSSDCGRWVNFKI